MTREEYYEKIWEWTPSTMVKHMPELTSYVSSEEIMEVIIEISFGDKKGATRLLRKALDAGIKFTGSQLTEMNVKCEESELIWAIKLSMEAEPFISEAKYTLKEIELHVPYKNKIRDIQLNMGRRIIFSDIYGDGFLVNWMIQRNIKKMIKAVEETYKEVQELKGKSR